MFASDASSLPDGNVTAGGKLRGTVVYEVPASMHSFTFDVDLDPFGQNDVVIWNLSM